eukprot:3242977-Pleurochrysis_carterae.AAC.1
MCNVPADVLDAKACAFGIDRHASELSWIVHRAAMATVLRGRVKDDSGVNASERISALDAHFLRLCKGCTRPWMQGREAVPLIIRNGVFRATALADFKAEDEMEIDLVKKVELLVYGDDPAPDGWLVAALLSAPKRRGLVPRSYVLPKDFRAPALYSFEPLSPGDLRFNKGDMLMLRPAVLECEGWWLGRRGETCGFV